MDFERPDGHRGDRDSAGREAEAEVLHPLEQVIEAVDQAGLDRGNVQRELERLTEANRAALELVGLGRDERLLAAEVGDHVHEHRGRVHRPIVNAGDVVDRLDRRTRLAEAFGEDVVLGLELDVAGAVVGRAAAIGKDLARAVVDYAPRRIEDVRLLEAQDPLLVGRRDLQGIELAPGVGQVGHPGSRVEPLLDCLLHAPVEGRDDLVATRVDLFAGIGVVGPTEDPSELVADLPDELGRLPGGRALG